MSVETPSGLRAAWARTGGAEVERGTLVRAGAIVALCVFALFAVPEITGTSGQYWLKVSTAAAIYSVVALGLGLLYGRVGMVSLCQIALFAIGAWTTARLGFGTGLPFPVLLLISGVVTALIGVLVGLPALRLSGLHLALITLMAGSAITLIFSRRDFPDGGTSFWGRGFGGLVVTKSLTDRRPSNAVSDTAYYRYTVIVCILLFLLALWHVSGKPGRAWAAIRESEPAALAAGVNITVYKLWAFALASFMTGVAGGLFAGDVPLLTLGAFPTTDSLKLLAVVLMGGIYSFWGAIVAGLLIQFLPAVLDNWGVSPEIATILFGVGVLQVITTAPKGIVDQFPRDMGKLGRLLWRLARKLTGPRSQAA